MKLVAGHSHSYYSIVKLNKPTVRTKQTFIKHSVCIYTEHIVDETTSDISG